MLDIQKQADPGWELPSFTCVALQSAGVLTTREWMSLGFPTSTSESQNASAAERRDWNIRISRLLIKKGWESIAYSNDNEPKDNRRRPAYAVLSRSQICVLGFEDVAGNAP
jgi:hypothetical protein